MQTNVSQVPSSQLEKSIDLQCNISFFLKWKKKGIKLFIPND